MNNDILVQQEVQYQQNLLKAYKESKKLFIRAEEILVEMKFFVAPMIEHRDALEHIMRYMTLKQPVLTQDALDELERALGHEIRAYFDIADFVCVTVREYIAMSLKRVSRKKIEKIWSDYSAIREEVVKVSEDIAEIRINRQGTMEYIDKYKPVLDKLFDIYNDYIINIEPKVKKKHL